MRKIYKRLTIRRRALGVYFERVKPHYPDQGHVARLAVLDSMHGRTVGRALAKGAWTQSRWNRSAARLDRLCNGKPAFGKPV